MNRLALECAAYRLPMLVGDGFVFENFEQYTRDRQEFLNNPEHLIQFLRATTYLEKYSSCSITDWHRENDAYVSRLIPALTWEYQIEFNLGPIVAALSYLNIEMELPEPNSIEPLVGLDPIIFELERDIVGRTLKRLNQPNI